MKKVKATSNKIGNMFSSLLGIQDNTTSTTVLSQDEWLESTISPFTLQVSVGEACDDMTIPQQNYYFDNANKRSVFAACTTVEFSSSPNLTSFELNQSVQTGSPTGTPVEAFLLDESGSVVSSAQIVLNSNGATAKFDQTSNDVIGDKVFSLYVKYMPSDKGYALSGFGSATFKEEANVARVTRNINFSIGYNVPLLTTNKVGPIGEANRDIYVLSDISDTFQYDLYLHVRNDMDLDAAYQNLSATIPVDNHQTPNNQYKIVSEYKIIDNFGAVVPNTVASVDCPPANKMYLEVDLKEPFNQHAGKTYIVQMIFTLSCIALHSGLATQFSANVGGISKTGFGRWSISYPANVYAKSGMTYEVTVGPKDREFAEISDANMEYTLSSNDVEFDWHINVDFDNVYALGNAMIVDYIDPALEIVSTQLYNRNTGVVVKKSVGSPTVSVDGNAVTLKYNNELGNMVEEYVLVIRTKHRDPSTAEMVKNTAFGSYRDTVTLVDYRSYSEPAYIMPALHDVLFTSVMNSALEQGFMNDDVVNWQIKTKFTDKIVDLLSMELVNTLNPLLELANDKNDIDIIGLNREDYTVDVKGQIITVVFKPRGQSFKHLLDLEIDLNIPTKIKDISTQAQIDTHLPITNTVEIIAIDQSGITSRIVEVSSPVVAPQLDRSRRSNTQIIDSKKPIITPIVGINTPVCPEISIKSLESGFIDNDMVNWSASTKFGSDAWNYASVEFITTLNPILELASSKECITVSGVNEDDYSIDTKENDVTISLNARNESFDYLADIQVEILIPTMIKEGVSHDDMETHAPISTMISLKIVDLDGQERCSQDTTDSLLMPHLVEQMKLATQAIPVVTTLENQDISSITKDTVSLLTLDSTKIIDSSDYDVNLDEVDEVDTSIDMVEEMTNDHTTFISSTTESDIENLQEDQSKDTDSQDLIEEQSITSTTVEVDADDIVEANPTVITSIVEDEADDFVEVNPTISTSPIENESDVHDNCNWDIKVNFGLEVSDFASVSIINTLNPVLELASSVDDISINGVNDEDYTVNVDEQSIIITLNKRDESFDYLDSLDMNVTVPTKLKEPVTQADLESNMPVTNCVELAITDEQGNNIRVNDVSNPVVLAVVEKTILDKATDMQPELDAGFVDSDVVFWNVNTKFGPDAHHWTSLVLKDTLNPIVELANSIDDIEITKLEPNDYSIELDGQVIIITLHPRNESFDYLAGIEIDVKIPTKVKDSVTQDELDRSLPITNTAEVITTEKDGYVGGDSDTAQPVMPPVLEFVPSHSNVDVLAEDMTASEDVINWTVNTKFEKDAQNWASVEIVNSLNLVLELAQNIDDIKVKGVDAQDLRIEQKGQDITIIFNPRDESFEYLSDLEIEVDIPTKIKEGMSQEEIDANSPITNTAEVFIYNKDDETFIAPSIVLPSVDSNTFIVKDNTVLIDDQDSLVEDNIFNDYGIVNLEISTKFDLDAANWSSVELVDTLNPVLELANSKDDITISELDPQDYSIDVNGQIITISFIDWNGTFAYLAGLDITVVIPTKLKDGISQDQINTAVQQTDVVALYTTDLDDLEEFDESMIDSQTEDLSDDNDSYGIYELTVHTTFDATAKNWSSVQLVDTLNPVLEVAYTKDDITLIGLGGDYYNIDIDGQEIIIDFVTVDDSFDYLVGLDIEVIIPTKLKEGVTQSDIDANSHFTISSEMKTVDKQVVVDKTDILDVLPLITNLDEMLLDSSHSDLPIVVTSVVEDSFANSTTANWNSTIKFGHDTQHLSTMQLIYTMNPLLELASGKDQITVSHLSESDYDIELDGQDISVIFNKKDENFSHLADCEVDICIPTKIKEAMIQDNIDSSLPITNTLVFNVLDVEGNHSSDTVVSNEVLAPIDFKDIVLSTSASDDEEQTLIIDDFEQTPIIDEVEQTSFIEEEEQTSIIDDVDQASIIEEVEQTLVIDDVDQTPIIEEVEQTLVIDDVDQASIIEQVEQTLVIDDVDQTPIIEEVEQTLVIDEVEPTPIINVIEQTPMIDKVEQVFENDIVLATSVIDDIVPTPVFNVVEKTHLIDGAQQTLDNDIDVVSLVNDDIVSTPVPDAKIAKNKQGVVFASSADVECLTSFSNDITWTTNFRYDNEIADWTYVSITSKINPILEVVDNITVKGVDPENMDIDDTGSTINFKPVDGRFDYLVGVDIAVIVLTRINPDATIHDLQASMKDGDITNVIELRYGNEEDSFKKTKKAQGIKLLPHF